MSGAKGQSPKVSDRSANDASVAPMQPNQARTPLGARLAAIRARIVASGTPLLSWDELDAELAAMRETESLQI